MKSIVCKFSFLAMFLGLFLVSSTIYSQEFDLKKYKTIYKFNTVKQSDNTRLLEASLIVQNKKNRKDKIPVFEADIYFMNVLNDEELLVGTSKTNHKGVAQFIAPASQKYLVDEDGYINLVAKFEGTKQVKGKDKEVAVKDLNFELDLEEIDSVKTVLVKAYSLDSLNAKIPLEEADMTVSVKGMLSNMIIEEGEIENGEFEYEFPIDIPGDENGDLIVIVKIDDHSDYGTVIQEKSVNWGTHKIDKIVKTKNTLWSKSAPLWMYIVLTIMLGGVWINYIYTIKNLFKIKKEGKALEAETK